MVLTSRWYSLIIRQEIEGEYVTCIEHDNATTLVFDIFKEIHQDRTGNADKKVDYLDVMTQVENFTFTKVALCKTFRGVAFCNAFLRSEGKLCGSLSRERMEELKRKILQKIGEISL